MAFIKNCCRRVFCLQKFQSQPDSKNSNTPVAKNDHSDHEETNSNDNVSKKKINGKDSLLIATHAFYNEEKENDININSIGKNDSNMNKGIENTVEKSEAVKQMMLFSALGEKNKLDKLFRKNAWLSIDEVDEQGRSALVYAILGGHQITINFILSLNPDLNLPDCTGKTSLHWAVIKDNAKLVSKLASKGANVLIADHHLNTPIHYSTSHTSLLHALIQYATSLDHQNSEKMTALHLACKQGDVVQVQSLLSHHSNPAIPDCRGYTPLHYAASSHLGDPVACIHALLEKYPGVIDWQDYEGCTPLHRSLLTHQPAIVHALLQAPRCKVSAMDNNFRTPLHWTVALNDVELTRMLMEGGADVSSSDQVGATPLHYAAQYNFSDVAEVLLQGEGVRDEDLDLEGRSAFMWACSHGSDATIEMLVRRGKSDVMGVDKHGSSGLHMAATMGHTSTMELLLCLGLPINATDNNNLTPLSISCQNGRFDVVQCLLNRGVDLMHRDQGGCLPIHWAALGGHEKVCELLLEHSNLCHATDHAGRTPLHCASYAGKTSCVLLLLDHHSDVNALDFEGKTSLHWACIGGHKEVIKQLIKHHALINVRDLSDDRYTCLDYCLLHEHKEACMCLLEHGALSITGIEEESAMKIQRWYRRRNFGGQHKLLQKHMLLKMKKDKKRLES